MNAILSMVIMNAGLATALAIVAFAVSRTTSRPALAHALWLLVLVKLITPPLFDVPLPSVVAKWIPPIESDRSNSISREIALRSVSDESLTPPNREFDHRPPSILEQAAESAAPITRSDLTTAVDVSGINSPEVAGSPAPRTGWLQVIQPGMAQWLPTIAIGIWLAGSALWFVRQSCLIIRFRRSIRDAEGASLELQLWSENLGRSMGLKRIPPVVVVPGVLSPMLSGVSRVRLLFPAQLLEHMDRAAIETLITHELAHYRRGDHWVRAMELVITGIYWWHPVVWWAKREIEAAEEECCDAWVVGQFPQSPRRYAEALLDTIDFLCDRASRVPPVASGIGHVPGLRKRLTMIMRGGTPKNLSHQARCTVALCAALMLPVQPGRFSQASTAIQSAENLSIVVGTLRVPSTAQPSSISDIDQEPQSIPAPPGPTSLQTVANPLAPPHVGVWATAISADGRYIVRALADRRVQLENVASGSCVELSPYRVLSMAFSPTGPSFVTGGADRRLRLWDAESGQEIWSVEAHNDSIRSVSYSPDGRTVLSGSDDGTVALWQSDTGELNRRLPPMGSAVNCARFSPSGQWLAVAVGHWTSLKPGRVVVLDVNSDLSQAELVCDSPPGVVAFESDSILATGSWDGKVTFWNLDGARHLTTFPGKKDLISAVRFSPDCAGFPQMSLVSAMEKRVVESWINPANVGSDSTSGGTETSITQ